MSTLFALILVSSKLCNSGTKVIQIIKCTCTAFIDNFRNISNNSSIYSTGVRKVDTLCRPFGGRPQVKRRFYRRLEAFVIVEILDFCPALLFLNRLPDNNSRNNDNSHTVGY